jgi:FHA domain/Domain of unknown function (DUF1707)
MRSTDRQRERALVQLRDGYAAGTLHTETLDLRIGRALRASTREELAGLTADLPAVGGPLRRVLRAVHGWLAPAPGSAGGGLLQASGLRSGQLVIGRSPSCELVFDDDTVSRRHAALRCEEGHWYLADLGSSNGTWVNGRRVFHVEVVAGDEVALGEARFRL